MFEKVEEIADKVRGKITEVVEGYKPFTPIGEKVKELILKYVIQK